jgi:hypothetical protein
LRADDGAKIHPALLAMFIDEGRQMAARYFSDEKTKDF